MAALKLAACAVLAVVLLLALIMGQPAAAVDCGECSKKCVADCRADASAKCKNMCDSTSQACDTCEATEWKKCATECYTKTCVSGLDTATQCPPLTTTCSACSSTCASPCNDIDQGLCDGDCLPPTGSASSTECGTCKDRAVTNCAAACRANFCGIILSCPTV